MYIFLLRYGKNVVAWEKEGIMSWFTKLFHPDARRWLVCPGNAFWGNEELIAVGQRLIVGSARKQFEDACKEAARVNNHTVADIYRAIEEGDAGFQQALLYALLHTAYTQRCAEKSFDIAAGYSFGFFASVLILLGAGLKDGVKAAYARGNAQKIACDYYGLYPPYNHLFSVPHRGDPEKIISELRQSRPGMFELAITNGFKVVIASTTDLTSIDGLPAGSETYQHMPYHHRDIMGAAGGLFLQFCRNQLTLDEDKRVTFVTGVGFQQVTFVSGTATEAFEWMAREVGSPIDFRPVVAAIRSGDEVDSLSIPDVIAGKKSADKLKIVCGGKRAPGTWHTHIAE